MTTETEIELHVYITSEDGTRHVAVFDGTIPYHRPEVDDLWGDLQAARRPAPLAGRVYVGPDATPQRIAEEVAFLALTEWPEPLGFSWRSIVFRRGPGRDSRGSEICTVLGDLHRVHEALVGGDLREVEQNRRIDIAAACRAAELRAEAEVQLEREACLDDAAAVAWLDGDRSALPRLLELAEAAHARSFGVYAGEIELLDTVIVRPPPAEYDVPRMDITERRWRSCRGRLRREGPARPAFVETVSRTEVTIYRSCTSVREEFGVSSNFSFAASIP